MPNRDLKTQGGGAHTACELGQCEWLLTKLFCFVVRLLRDCDVSQINYMYGQYVKNTMQPLNIADVTKDQRFPWTVSTRFLFLFIFFASSVLFCFSFLLFLKIPLSSFLLDCLWQSENPDHTSNQIKSLLCTPIRNGKKDKVIGRLTLFLSIWCGPLLRTKPGLKPPLSHHDRNLAVVKSVGEKFCLGDTGFQDVSV